MKLAIAALLLLPLLAQAGQASPLPLKMAKDKGFTGCDATINKAFEFTTGQDVRINAAWFDETKGDSIKLTTTSSSPGDSLFIEAEFRKQGGKCYSTTTAILTSDKTCIAYKEDVPAFKIKHVVGEFVWTENSGGIDMYLKSVGNGCMAVYQISNKQPLQF